MNAEDGYEQGSEVFRFGTLLFALFGGGRRPPHHKSATKARREPVAGGDRPIAKCDRDIARAGGGWRLNTPLAARFYAFAPDGRKDSPGKAAEERTIK